MSEIEKIRQLGEKLWSENKEGIKEDFIETGAFSGPGDTISQIAQEKSEELTEDLVSCTKICDDYLAQKNPEIRIDYENIQAESDDVEEQTANLARAIAYENINQVMAGNLDKVIDGWQKEYESRYNSPEM